MSLIEDQGQIVLSSRKATAILVCIVVLLAMSFAAGFVIGSAR